MSKKCYFLGGTYTNEGKVYGLTTSGKKLSKWFLSYSGVVKDRIWSWFCVQTHNYFGGNNGKIFNFVTINNFPYQEVLSKKNFPPPKSGSCTTTGNGGRGGWISDLYVPPKTTLFWGRPLLHMYVYKMAHQCPRCAGIRPFHSVCSNLARMYFEQIWVAKIVVHLIGFWMHSNRVVVVLWEIGPRRANNGLTTAITFSIKD